MGGPSTSHHREYRELVDDALERAEPLVPVAEASARRLREIIESDDSESGALRELVSEDCAFAAEVMRAAHSPLFGGLPTLRELEPALERVGTPECLSLLAHSAERARAFLGSPWARPRLATLFLHARRTARAAAWIACRARLPHLAESAQLVGLLHDIGKLVLVKIIDDRYGALPDPQLETLLGQEHPGVGARMLARWRLAPDIVDAVARHHEAVPPGDASVLLAILRLADDASHRVDRSRAAAPLDASQARHLDALGLPSAALAELAERVLPRALPA